MTPRRLSAPATDGGVLVDPPWSAVGGLAAANARRLAEWDYDVQGRGLSRLRELARAQVIQRARRFLERYGLADGVDARAADVDGHARPLVVTGHQPELFHPGVWIKNFAAAAIARSCGGIALNLIVDNDIPKDSAIRVPGLQDGRLRAVSVEFDRWPGELPYEDWHVGDESMFASFPRRVHQVLDAAVADPLLDEFWSRAARRRKEVSAVGQRFSLARREIEASWGVSNLEVPLGAVCETDAFLWFASHLIAQLPRYQAIHNDCLAEYRAAHHIRSRHHPVAALAADGDWLEAPFWVWRAGRPRRRALLARQCGRMVDLRIAGEAEAFASLPLSPDSEACCAVERLRDLPADSIRLRTRALTTTMFARLVLGDLFIHGIGGAKYDELGDELIRRFCGFEPPGFLTLSMTLRLPLPAQPPRQEDLITVNREIRDLAFNPERYLHEPIPEELRRIIAGKRAAIAGPVASRRERVARARAIRRNNDAMQQWVEAIRGGLLERRRTIREAIRSNRVARSREFASVLHSERRLEAIMRGVGSALEPASRGGLVTPGG